MIGLKSTGNKYFVQIQKIKCMARNLELNTSDVKDKFYREKNYL